MARRTAEPFLWLLFSAGGVASAMLFPVLLFLLGLAFPLGWLSAPDYNDVLGLLRNPLTLLVVFGVCVVALFHWAHRFRYTLDDGLQLKKVDTLIATLCYGGAVVGSVLAAIVLWQVR
jgi:fumarate reductase subunit D